MRRVKKIVKLVVLSLLLTVGYMPVAQAACTNQQSCSNDYGVNEVFFGSGGELNACSTNFCSKQSAGELTVGNTSSNNFQAQGGFNSDRTPYLQFIVNATNIDLGVLSTSTTKVATATFSVKTYLASGYVVVNASAPPTNDGHSMTGLSSPTASSTGTEQFGINLVANSCPAGTPGGGAGGCSGGFGAAPVQKPSSSFSSGLVAPGYDTTNKYKYVNGDTIAYDNKSSGETDYTISYLFNINDTTAGGTYTMQHVLVATSTF